MRIGITKKVMGLFTIGAVLFFMTAASSFFIMNRLYGMIHETDSALKKAELADNLRNEVNRLFIIVTGFLVTGNEEARDRFDDSVNRITELLTEIRSQEGGERWHETADHMGKDAALYAEKALEILYVEHPVGNEKGIGLIKELDLLGQDILKEAEGFYEIARKEVEQKQSNAMSLKGFLTAFALSASGILFLSMLVSYLYLRKSIINPLRELHRGAEIIANGGLSHRLNISTGDEIEELANEFNFMAGSLQKARADLDRKVLELYMLYNISKVLSSSLEKSDLLTKAVEFAGSGLNIDLATVMLVDHETQELSMGAHTASAGEVFAKRKYRMGEGIFGLAAADGKARILDSVALKNELSQDTLGLHFDFSSAVIIPLSTQGRIIGLLSLFRRAPGSFSNEEFNLLVTVSEHITLALENERLYREIKTLAITDGLTGLYNHRFFRTKLEEEVERGRRYGHPFSLIMIDVDNFKTYNDLNGHLAGDSVLRELGCLLKLNLRSSDSVARYGGEEFVVLLSETDKQSALSMAERLRAAVQDHSFPFRERQPGGMLTISLGVASFPLDATYPDELVKKADAALYLAKSAGKNRVHGSEML